MKKPALLLSAIFLAIGVTNVPAAKPTVNTGPFEVPSSTTSTTPQNLNANGNSGIVDVNGTLNVSGTVAVQMSSTGSTSIYNAGTIESSTDRAIRANQAGGTFTITNTSGGLITSQGDDAFQMNQTGTLTIYNYGTISATAKKSQAVNMNISLSSTGTETPYSGTVYNYSGATITSAQADALRLGAGNTLYNSGTIMSAGGTGTSNDGIDLQVNNSGVTIINGASQTTLGGTTSANLIEGARHGITGGQQVDTAAVAGNTTGSFTPALIGLYDVPFTETIINNAHSTIKGDDGSGINIDGVDATEQVTITNAGLISGNGVTADGDGVDIDGVVNLTNSGTIISLTSLNDTSEGVTVGGGSIVNSGLIEGSVVNLNGTNTAVGRGITLAGVDNVTNNGTKTSIPIQKIYATTTVLNSGLIKGDSEAGIGILGITGTTNYSVTITNTAGGIIEGGSHGSIATIDGSSNITVSGTGAASSNNETVINYGTIKADYNGKAIALGMGLTNTVQIEGGSAQVLGDMSGAVLTGSNASYLIIDPGASNTFNYDGAISNFTSIEFASGTTNLGGTATFNTGFSYANTATIDANATLDLVGSVSGTGTLLNTGALNVGNNAVFNLDGQTINVGTLTNSGTINNGTVNASNVTGLTGTTSYTKTGNSTLALSGSYTTGGMTVSGGKLAVNGSLTGSVVVNSGAEVGGHGTIIGSIKGSGSVGPGNSPGILTASSTDPTGGLSYNFEFTQAGSPTWSVAAASGNDVLHLTATLGFTADGTTDAPLTSANVINLYFSGLNMTYQGGFFVDGSTSTLAADIANATYNYYLLDNAHGTFEYNGNLYDVLSANQVTASVVEITNAKFDGVNNTIGYTEQYVVVVPEPSTYLMLGAGLGVLLQLVRRRAGKNRS